MTPSRSRRRFLSELGCGMAALSLGPALASDLGWRVEEHGDLTTEFDPRFRKLIDLVTDTPPDRLQPILIERLKAGSLDLKTLVSATAVANAMKFGGEDYTGYHAFMALEPALQMAEDLPTDEKALPVLKVVWRNAHRIQQKGGRRGRVLVRAGNDADEKIAADAPTRLRDLTRNLKWDDAERLFGGMMNASHEDAWNGLQPTIRECTDVHRVVLAWRSFDMVRNTGFDYARTLLRQNVRFAVDRERMRRRDSKPVSQVRKLVPALLDDHGLMNGARGTRRVDAAWIERHADLIYRSSKADAAEATAKALAKGIHPEDVGDAISVASNALILRQERDWKGKLKVHGASKGVHASDATNAWRNIARTCGPKHAAASLIVAAHHACKGNLYKQAPLPHEEHLARIDTRDPSRLVAMAADAIKNGDHGGTCAAIQTYFDLGHAAGPLKTAIVRAAVNDDGSLHHEKYWHTVKEETARARPEHKTRQYVALGRVLASGSGERAPGVAEARKLLG